MDEMMQVSNELSKAEFDADDALRKLKQAQKAYNEAKMNECIQNILNVQKEDGKITERDLKIYISDFLSWAKK